MQGVIWGKIMTGGGGVLILGGTISPRISLPGLVHTPE